LNGVYLAEEVADFDSKPRYAKEVVELVHEAPSAKEVPSLPEPPKETTNNVEIPNNAEIQGEIVEGEISWEANWWTPEVEAMLADVSEVNAYLVKKGKIKDGQTWKDIKDETYRSNLVAKTSKFIEAVLKAK
jgi:hypothetical protein